MARISMNLPEELVNEFDECLKEKGFNSRSKGLQDVIWKYIINHNNHFK